MPVGSGEQVVIGHIIGLARMPQSGILCDGTLVQVFIRYIEDAQCGRPLKPLQPAESLRVIAYVPLEASDESLCL